MWELAFIARDFPDRRKVIYEDIDRKDGPMWSQVYKICLDVLKSMESNIEAYVTPPAPPAPSSGEATAEEQEKIRTTEPPREEPIFQPFPERKGLRNHVEKAVGQVALSPGQGSQLSPVAKKAVDSAKEQLLRIQKETTGTDDAQSLFRGLSPKAFRSGPLEHYQRRLVRAVLGDPYGEPSLYVNAACALAGLAVHSLREDKYGHVQRDVAALIRALTGLAAKLEGFRNDALATLQGTTVDQGKPHCPEVEEVLAALRDAIARLLDAFGPYARDLRLSLTDIRLAREAAGLGAADEVEMREFGWKGGRWR